MLVTIDIDEEDWFQMMRHFANRHPGRRLVAVNAVIDCDVHLNDDRPLSVEMIQEYLAEVEAEKEGR